MTDPVCAHGERPLDGCPDCDPPALALRGIGLAVLAVAIFAGAFAAAWWWVA